MNLQSQQLFNGPGLRAWRVNVQTWCAGYGQFRCFLFTCLILLVGSDAAPAGSPPSSTFEEPPAQAEVDLIELNHFLDDTGREVFQQIIFYDWSRHDRQLEVRAWRLVKQPSQLPRRLRDDSGYRVRWRDKGKVREVVSTSLRETFSRQDPERENRRLVPENERIPLWQGF
ncbi:MAG: hypothetical protein CBB71_09335 [Rhodopirellula sp. TMED11]|nr:MAG: hypothetical protein CBB71_09335 [Rhodopirellula sp. TMED11]